MKKPISEQFALCELLKKYPNTKVISLHVFKLCLKIFYFFEVGGWRWGSVSFVLVQRFCSGPANLSRRLKSFCRDLIVLCHDYSRSNHQVLTSSKESKGSKHKSCKIREAEAASKIAALESQVQSMEKKWRIATHKLLDVTTKEVELRKLYQAKCIECSRYKEQNRSIQRELILLQKKV